MASNCLKQLRWYSSSHVLGNTYFLFKSFSIRKPFIGCIRTLMENTGVSKMLKVALKVSVIFSLEKFSQQHQGPSHRSWRDSKTNTCCARSIIFQNSPATLCLDLGTCLATIHCSKVRMILMCSILVSPLSHCKTPCAKSFQIWSYFWSVFSYIQFEYGKIETRNNSLFGYFSRSTYFAEASHYFCYTTCDMALVQQGKKE